MLLFYKYIFLNTSNDILNLSGEVFPFIHHNTYSYLWQLSDGCNKYFDKSEAWF